MRGHLATVIAGAAVCAGCATDEGLVVTIHVPPGADLSEVGKLELFLGGAPDPTANNRRIRNVFLDGSEDLRPVDGSVDGFTIFLQGVPDDVELAAIAAFRDTPEEPTDFPIALAIIDPLTFTPGQAIAIDVMLQPTSGNGGMGSAARWRGAPLVAPPIGHSCLAWSVGDNRYDQIVRDQDYDCDGTLPTACSDPGQYEKDVPDDLPRQDADGDGVFTCDRCTTTAGLDVACECNDDPTNRGAEQYFGNRPEVCDGLDNDCDDTTFFITHPDQAHPCVLGDPGGCRVGVKACDERLGDVEPETCKDTITTEMIPCGVAIDSCSDVTACQVDSPAGASAQTAECNLAYTTTPCLGTVELASLVEDLDPAPSLPVFPTTCSAVLWGSPNSGSEWRVWLDDPLDPLPSARVFQNVPCDTLHLAIESAPSSISMEAQTSVITMFDTATGERYAMPLTLRTYVDSSCTAPPVICNPPGP